MDPFVLGIIGIITLLVLMVLRVPVAYGMLAVGLVGIALLRGWNAGTQLLVTTLYTKFTSNSYSAIPFFVFMGFAAYHAGMLERLFDMAKKWVGHISGGLVMSGIVSGGAFGAVCGAGAASEATLCRLVVPELIGHKTERKLAYGSVLASGVLAPLIPPSVIGMLIAVVLEVSIGQVLMGGLLPGILCMILYCVYAYITVKRHPEKAPPYEKSGWGARGKSLLHVMDFLLIMLLVVVGIYTGFFSATEAGAIASVAVLIILACKKRLTIKVLKECATDTLRTVATAFFVVGTSFTFSAFLTMTQIPARFAGWLVGLSVPSIVIVLGIALFFIILGMFMDIMTIIYVTVPILAPTISVMGYDLVWFAVILLMFTCIGTLTPPFGGHLFIMKGAIEDSTMGEIYKGVMPFVWLTIIGTLLCIFIPQIVTLIPSLM